MRFGQIEQEGLDEELWSPWQRNQSLDYLHVPMRQEHKSQNHWRSQHQKSEHDSIRSSSKIRWLTKLLEQVKSFYR